MRYVPKMKPVEAWEVTEDNYEDLATMAGFRTIDSDHGLGKMIITPTSHWFVGRCYLVYDRGYFLTGKEDFEEMYEPVEVETVELYELGDPDPVSVVVMCGGDHKPVQHRDAREPWCRNCGRTKDGREPKSFIKRDKNKEGDVEDQERCTYCGEMFPKPVSLHHDEQECIANKKWPPSTMETKAQNRPTPRDPE